MRRHHYLVLDKNGPQQSREGKRACADLRLSMKLPSVLLQDILKIRWIYASRVVGIAYSLVDLIGFLAPPSEAKTFCLEHEELSQWFYKLVYRAA
uniref:Uncharacterized protein n=1 Tax=Glossina palpalis gambiensis TaxID=67801 RepID=A0A1B0AKD0_9MUSC